MNVRKNSATANGDVRAISRVGIDIGGTFTDVAAAGSDGKIYIGKRLTSSGNEHLAAAQAAGESGVELSSVDLLAHGTTLVINALLERETARTALVTTKGFADIHELATDARPEPFCLDFGRNPPLVPREMRFEVDERIDAFGNVLQKPDTADIDELIETLRNAGVDSVAVAFMNSYKQPEHEIAIGTALRKAFPDIPITLSSDLSQRSREYQRFTTAAANAAVAPLMRNYLSRLDDGLRALKFDGDLVVLDSNGGAQSLDVAMEFPLRTVESGPVSGALASRNLAMAHGVANLVTFDMGGTTAKTCLIENGKFTSTDLYWVGEYARGFPVQVPCIDIIEVGAGGGSIAWLENDVRLRVGPRSAGSSPGPACYGLGGTEVTVTDANFYSGRMPQTHLSGALALDAEAAHNAIESLAARANLPPMRLALGVLKIAVLSMATAVRRQTLERGRDPREFWLVASGGAGPMHACEVAREVGIRTVAIPMHPGHYSAIGMLSADLRFEKTVAVNERLSALTPDQLHSMMTDMRASLADMLGGVGASAENIEYDYSLMLRYVGQEHSLKIGSGQNKLFVPEDFEEKFSRWFEEEYTVRFGHANSLSEIEVVQLEVVGRRALPHPDIVPAHASLKAERRHTKVYFDSSEQPLDTVVIDRRTLSRGDKIEGSAIIFEEGSTSVIPPGANAEVLDDMTILVTL
ncbi:hydantoinase/oxoprolinase family protein [Hyphococcus sp.]|uniref:hydantoinase/oxoprolinase family protein n=1 Tax=Hyphococcus sp. TaxID=2038636 RepID=UPI003CCBD5B6